MASVLVETVVVGHEGLCPQSISIPRRASLTEHSAQANLRHLEAWSTLVTESSSKLCATSMSPWHWEH